LGKELCYDFNLLCFREKLQKNHGIEMSFNFRNQPESNMEMLRKYLPYLEGAFS